MDIVKVGDVAQVICSHCKALTRATYKLRDVPFSDGSGTAKRVLVGVCDQCDQVSVLPNQSIPAVKRQFEAQRKPIESRLPAHLVDILNLASSELGGSSDSVPSLVKYYIHVLASDEKASLRLKKLIESDLAKGKSEKRLSLKGRKLAEEIDRLKSAAKIENTSDLIKGVVLKIHEDILVRKNKKQTEALRTLFAVMA